MSYKSIDEIQNELAKAYFDRTSDAKKASGRALGTFVELITYYWIKENGFFNNLSIETKLPEYGNHNLTHNVEFTLHKILSSKEHIPLDYTTALSINKILKNIQASDKYSMSAYRKTGVLLNRKKIIKNGLYIGETDRGFVLSYIDTESNTYRVTELSHEACAMFECKRVGKEGDFNVYLALGIIFVINMIVAIICKIMCTNNTYY